LSLLLIRTKIHALTENAHQTYYLSGNQGSAAAALDYALSKSPQWLYDFFGADSSGTLIARRLFSRINPERKRPGPVKLAVNERFCPSKSIHIRRDGYELSDLKSLIALEAAMRGSFRGPLAEGGKIISLTESAKDSSIIGANQAYALIDQIWQSDTSTRDISIRHLLKEMEVKKLWELDRVSYEGYELSWPTFRTWWELYPIGLKTFFINDILSGTLSIWPLGQKSYDAFVAGQLKEEEMIPCSVTRSPDLPTSYWYIGGIFIGRNFRSQGYFAELFHGAISSWVEDKNYSFPMSVLALGSTAAGITILKKLGFKQLQPSGNMPDLFPLYELVVDSRMHLLSIVSNIKVQR
jgi:hypothetical protein